MKKASKILNIEPNETLYLKQEICSCGHFRSEHRQSIDGIPGHGSCKKCKCAKFSWKAHVTPQPVSVDVLLGTKKWKKLSNLLKARTMAIWLRASTSVIEVSGYDGPDTTSKPAAAETDLNAFVHLFDGVKAFEVEKEIIDLLLKTKNKVRETRLPFPIIFIDCPVILPDVWHKSQEKLVQLATTFYGFLVAESGTHKIARDNIVILPQPQGRPDPFIYIYSVFSTEQMGMGHVKFHLYDAPDPKDKMQKEAKTICEFVMNFLDFLYDPDVEWVEVMRFHDESRKAAKKGKGLRVPTRVVKVKGVLRKYLNELKLGRHFEYSHRFWVRGHWRHLKAPRWKQKRGIRIWIPPFVKGSGILIDKRYRLEAHKEVKKIG